MVRVTGLEPVRRGHTPLKRACLPIPAHSHIPRIFIAPDYYSTKSCGCQQKFYSFLKILFGF